MAERDNRALVAVGVVTLASVGIFLAVKAGEKRTARPGDTIIARFIFDYNGPRDTYVLQVSLGVLSSWFRTFDHIEGMTWQKTITLPGPGRYTEDLECLIPLGAKPGAYDAEALIKTTGMRLLQYIVKHNVARAITVEA